MGNNKESPNSSRQHWRRCAFCGGPQVIETRDGKDWIVCNTKHTSAMFQAAIDRAGSVIAPPWALEELRRG